MEDMVKKVEQIRLEKKYNCAQCLVCAYADKLEIDEKTLFKLSEAFGGGVAGTGGLCGAVSGMCFVGGYLASNGDISGKPNTYSTTRALIEEFQAKNGSVICHELKGISGGKPMVSCMDCIKSAAAILEEHF